MALSFVKIWYDYLVIDYYLSRGVNMKIIQASIIILIWAIPIFSIRKTYKKWIMKKSRMLKMS